MSGEILFPDGQFRPGHVLISGPAISQVAPGPAPAGLEVWQACPEPGRRVAGWVLPGFIDLQVNGGFGVDLTSEPARLPELARALPRTGVTSFLPTIITSPIERYPELLTTLTRAAAETEGAQPLGVHLEGPYLSPQRPGAHSPALLRPPAPAELEVILSLADVRLVTLAPELPRAGECIRLLRERGVVVGMGHSAATYDEAKAAIAAGVGYATHLFNAMSPLDHRQPGLVGALLDAPIPVGLIVDGVHLHPAAVRLAWRVKGPEGLTLVTDAVATAGLTLSASTALGEHLLGNRRLIAEGYTVRLSDGTLAGSTLTMDQAVRNLVAFTGCSLAEATTAASRTPARVLGLDGRKGLLAPGWDADIVVLNEDLQVVLTIARGQILHERRLEGR